MRQSAYTVTALRNGGQLCDVTSGHAILRQYSGRRTFLDSRLRLETLGSVIGRLCTVELNGKMNVGNDYRRIWKEAVEAYFELLTPHSRGGTEYSVILQCCFDCRSYAVSLRFECNLISAQ
jgi:hypothetical protein